MKLINYHRSKIAERAVTAAFAERKAELEAEECILAQDVYNAIISAKHREAMSKLPEKFFCRSKQLRAAVGGRYHYLNSTIMFSIPNDSTSTFAKFLPDHPLGLRIDECVRRREKLREDREAAQATTYRMLLTFSTVERLRAGWPDGAPFYAELDKLGPIKTLPAIVVADVNKLLGLPKAA